MNAPTQKPPQLLAVRFVSPIQFAGVTDSVRLGVNCTSVCPARIEPDGMAVPTDKGQPSQGLLIRGSGRGFHTQSFAAWANVAEMVYGPGDSK